MIEHLNKVLNITKEEIKAELDKRHHVRLAKSRKYVKNERVTPIDTQRAKGRDEYLFVSSIRWGRSGNYGGYLLFNPRTCNLISATNIASLDYPSKNLNRHSVNCDAIEL